MSLAYCHWLLNQPLAMRIEFYQSLLLLEQKSSSQGQLVLYGYLYCLVFSEVDSVFHCCEYATFNSACTIFLNFMTSEDTGTEVARKMTIMSIKTTAP